MTLIHGEDRSGDQASPGLADVLRAVGELDRAAAGLRVAISRLADLPMDDAEGGLLAAAALEQARSARLQCQDICLGLAEEALSRGNGPRALDWSDPRES